MTKILVSLDARLLRRIDAAARRLGLTRSAYLSRLAERAVVGDRGPGADPKVGRAMHALDRLFAANSGSGDVAATIRRARDERGAELLRRTKG